MREEAKRREEEFARDRLAASTQSREARMEQEAARRMDKYAAHPYNENSKPYQHNNEPQAPEPQKGLINAPAPPERKSSYDVTRGGTPPSGPYDTSQSYRGSNNRQPPDMLGPKKSVSFDSNLATEMNAARSGSGRGGSLSPQDIPPPPPSTSPPSSSPENYQYNPYAYRPSNNSNPPPLVEPPKPNYSSPMTPVASMPNEGFDTPPANPPTPQQLVAGPTPGVIGAQEVYRDPRQRIQAARQAQSQLGTPKGPGPERMSFRDKMKMFAVEAGENTPRDRQKTSRAQRNIEYGINGQQ